MSIRAVLVTLFATFGACTLSTGDDDSTATLTIENAETYSISNIYVSEAGTYENTDDLLTATGTLAPGGSVQVMITCGTYDLELVAASGSDCYIENFDLCANADTWIINDGFVLGCQADEP